MQTLEQWGAEAAREAGYDPNLPAVQQQIAKVAATVRQQMPGADDATIIAQAGPSVKASLAEAKRRQGGAPAAPAAAAQPAQPVQPAAPTPEVGSVDAALAARQRVDAEFSPQAEKKVRDSSKWTRIGADVGRLLSTGYRVQASPQAQAALDAQYKETMAAADEPLIQWQERKKAAVAKINEELQLGRMRREEVEGQLRRIGLEQAMAERKDAATLAAAEADPMSVTSEAMRALARQFAPDFVKTLGDRFESLTAAQLKAQLPALEKAYLKRLEADQKKAELEDKANERATREKVAATGAAATVEAARIRAGAQDRATAARRAGGGGGGAAAPAPTAEPGKVSIVKRDKQGNVSLDSDAAKALETIGSNAALANDGLAITQRMRQIINTGNASQSKLGNVISGGMSAVGLKTDRVRADEALAGSVDSLIGVLAKFDPRAKGAPSNADIQGIKDTINNPNASNDEKRAALDRLEVLLNRMVETNNSALGGLDTESLARLELRGVRPVNQPPKAPPVPGATARMKDRNGKIYNIPRDRVQEAIADGLLPAE